MSKILFIAVLMVLASRGHAGTDFIDTAQVVSSTPLVERISEPRQECGPAPAAAPSPAQQCRTVQVTREVIKGYTVVYHYSGRNITVVLPYDPGPTVRVGVGIVDSAPAASAPAASTLGANVREVRPAPVSNPAPPSVNPTGTGGYQYRY